MNCNLPDKIDSIYFEDICSKAILFREAERIYGIKPNSIGDMRYITVPYTISLLGFLIENKLDLYKIWKNQSISEELKQLIYKMMVEVENYIKANAPGSLYGEWAKKEDCWEELKRQKWDFELSSIENDFENSRILLSEKG